MNKLLVFLAFRVIPFLTGQRMRKPLLLTITAIPLLLGLLLATCLPTTRATAKTFYCTNCSTSLVQALDRVTNMEELSNMVKQYSELVQQTEQQIRMVQQNIQQYANMVQNTLQLPQQLVSGLKDNFTRLAQLTSSLRTLRGDATGLAGLFTQIFPEQATLKGLAAGSSPEDVRKALEQYQSHWDTWSAEVDRASMATFQLSGQQLEDLQQDGQKFQDYIDNLLSKPEGQMQALMAGNNLAAVQIQEARELRSLIATTVQSDLQSQMKSEKEAQMQEELQRKMFEHQDVIINTIDLDE